MSDLHPLLKASIDMQGIKRRTSKWYQLAPCGCYIPDDRTSHGWDFCQYHEGYADALDALERQP